MKLVSHCSMHQRYFYGCGCCHQARIEELEALVVLYRRELVRLADVVCEEDHASIMRLIGTAPDTSGEAGEARAEGEER